jgi:hypothetical protein
VHPQGRQPAGLPGRASGGGRARCRDQDPSGALAAILGRCARKKLVRREHNVYRPNRKRLDKLDYAPTRSEAIRQHGCLLGKLCDFARERYGLDWSEEDAETALLTFLQHASVPLLAAATDGDPLPPARPRSRKARHVVSSFAGHLSESDPEGFECLETVVKGHILSGVLFYPDVGAVQKQFSELDVYFDTPFLLPTLGYAEEGLHLYCLDLVELLAELGANLRCYHHTREEVVGVLENEAARIRAGGGGDPEPVDYSTSRSFRPHEVEEMVIKIDDSLRELGIEVIDRPDRAVEPDEAALDEHLEGEMHYWREKAREKDVWSLAGVARLRQQRRAEKLESAKAIFVTTNTRLARASSSFFKEIEGQGAVPICLPVEMMTRLAWVKKPLSAPELPKHVVMASSYAALNPSAPLWRKYLGAIKRRRERGELTDDEYHVLRSSHEARQALMDETLGDEQAFSAGTLDEVLEHARRAIQAEAEAETAEERRGREAAEKRAETERGKREGIERAHRDRVDVRARRAGAIVGWGLGGVLLAVVFAGGIATVPGFPIAEIKPLGWKIVMWACVAIFFGLTISGIAVKGVSVFDLRQELSEGVERRWRGRGHRKLDELHADASKD